MRLSGHRARDLSQISSRVNFLTCLPLRCIRDYDRAGMRADGSPLKLDVSKSAVDHDDDLLFKDLMPIIRPPFLSQRHFEALGSYFNRNPYDSSWFKPYYRGKWHEELHSETRSLRRDSLRPGSSFLIEGGQNITSSRLSFDQDPSQVPLSRSSFDTRLNSIREKEHLSRRSFDTGTQSMSFQEMDDQSRRSFDRISSIRQKSFRETGRLGASITGLSIREGETSFFSTESDGSDEVIKEESCVGNLLARDGVFIHFLNEFVFLNQLIAVSGSFNAVVIASIVIAGILVGVDTYPSMQQRQGVVAFEWVVQAVFTVDCVVKISREGRAPWRYW